MQYLCSQCRRPLQTGLSMCGCGQVFSSPVPNFDPNGNSMFWPPASEARPAIIQWWTDLSPAIKAIFSGVAVLVMGVIAIGSSVHHYQSLHARYAPGTPVMTASAAPVPVQKVPAAPSMPAPVIMQAEPRYVPPQGKSLYVPPQDQRSDQIEAAPSYGSGLSGSQDEANSPNPVVDARAQVEAASNDALNVLVTAQAALPNMSVNPVMWTTLESQVAKDRSTISNLQGNVAPEIYNVAMQKIDQAARVVEEDRATWEKAKAMSGIDIA